MEQKKYEIVKFVDNGFELEVNVSPKEETVWLNQEQLCLLFDVDLSRISRHINAIYNSKELEPKGTLAENAIVQKEGTRFVTRTIKMYNLDMIIAVGYRVNSKRGTIFRQWANRVLKQYMLKGFAIDSSRVLVTQENYLDLVNVVNRIDSTQSELVARVEKLENKYPELNEKVLWDGHVWDAVSCLENLISKAEKSIVLMAYNELIHDSVILRSMSRVGTPGDNPVNESLNGWIKEELFMDFHINDCRDRDDVIAVIERYVDYYNSKRPSWALDYDTPDSYYKRFMNGEIEHKETFSNRVLSEIPKSRKKKKESTFENANEGIESVESTLKNG